MIERSSKAMLDLAAHIIYLKQKAGPSVALRFADAVENALEFSMMIRGANDSLARLAFLATSLKTVCFTVGLVLLAAALAGFFKLRAHKKAETD